VRIPVIETPDLNYFKARKRGPRSQLRDANGKKLGARPAFAHQADLNCHGRQNGRIVTITPLHCQKCRCPAPGKSTI
jgi:hypothetical protein